MRSRRAVIRLSISAVVAVLLGAVLARHSFAWWSGGHKACTLAAASKLPADMPQFFRDAGKELAEMSAEPDNWKSVTTSHLRGAEQPEHFIDLEFLGDEPLPAVRYDLLKFYFSKNVDPSKAGTLPCAIIEGYERLMLAFRDYRNAPDSEIVKKRVIVYAGWMSHYCEDAAMPLHTTKDYDGRNTAGGVVEQKGIHARIDAYPEKNGIAAEQIAEGLAAKDAVNVWPLIVDAIKASHTHVDECYKLDAQGAFDRDPESGRALILERTRAAAKLTLDLWYSAWMNSDPKRATVK
jgi:hypothetical protein